MTVPISYYLLLSGILFVIGVIGVLTRRNVIIILMSIELILNAVNINLVAFSRYADRGLELLAKGGTAFGAQGQSLVLMSITVAAAEAAVGLAIVVSIYRNFRHITVDDLDLLRW